MRHSRSEERLEKRLEGQQLRVKVQKLHSHAPGSGSRETYVNNSLKLLHPQLSSPFSPNVNFPTEPRVVDYEISQRQSVVRAEASFNDVYTLRLHTGEWV